MTTMNNHNDEVEREFRRTGLGLRARPTQVRRPSPPKVAPKKKKGSPIWCTVNGERQWYVKKNLDVYMETQSDGSRECKVLVKWKASVPNSHEYLHQIQDNFSLQEYFKDIFVKDILAVIDEEIVSVMKDRAIDVYECNMWKEQADQQRRDEGDEDYSEEENEDEEREVRKKRERRSLEEEENEALASSDNESEEDEDVADEYEEEEEEEEREQDKRRKRKETERREVLEKRMKEKKESEREKSKKEEKKEQKEVNRKKELDKKMKKAPNREESDDSQSDGSGDFFLDLNREKPSNPKLQGRPSKGDQKPRGPIAVAPPTIVGSVGTVGSVGSVGLIGTVAAAEAGAAAVGVVAAVAAAARADDARFSLLLHNERDLWENDYRILKQSPNSSIPYDCINKIEEVRSRTDCDAVIVKSLTVLDCQLVVTSSLISDNALDHYLMLLKETIEKNNQNEKCHVLPRNAFREVIEGMKLEVNLFEIETVLVPGPCGPKDSGYWGLAVLKPNDLKAMYFDTIGCEVLEVLKRIRTFLEVYHQCNHGYALPKYWRVESVPSPRSRNHVDCAPMALEIATMAYHNHDLSNVVLNGSVEMRLKVAYRLINWDVEAI